jgi:hypothetical protein
MSALAEQKHDEFSTWFENNCNRYPIVGQEQRWEFLIKCVVNLAIINAQLINDLRELEQRGQKLYLPSGLRWTGDLTRVG